MKCNKRFKRSVYVDDSQHKAELHYYKEKAADDDGKRNHETCYCSSS